MFFFLFVFHKHFLLVVKISYDFPFCPKKKCNLEFCEYFKYSYAGHFSAVINTMYTYLMFIKFLNCNDSLLCISLSLSIYIKTRVLSHLEITVLNVFVQTFFKNLDMVYLCICVYISLKPISNPHMYTACGISFCFVNHCLYISIYDFLCACIRDWILFFT